MKKILLILCAALILIGCASNQSSESEQSEQPEKTDAQRFKEEYEGHNGEYDDARGHDFIEVEVDEDNPVVYATMQDFFDLIDDGKSGIVYFGFPECPWCRTLVPSLLNALKVGGIERLYYVNNYDERDLKELDADGNIVTTQQGSEDYYKLLEVLGDYAQVYAGLNDESIKHMYYPTVLFIKNGEIVAMHTGTVDSQENVWDGITEQQRDELEAALMEKINMVYAGACSISQEKAC